MRCTVPVPMPSDFATSEMPTPLRKILSHLPLGLAVDLRPAELHALSNRSLEARQFIAQAARLGSRAAFVRGGATCGLSNQVGSPAAESPSRRKALTAASRPYTSHDLGPGATCRRADRSCVAIRASQLTGATVVRRTQRRKFGEYNRGRIKLPPCLLFVDSCPYQPTIP